MLLIDVNILINGHRRNQPRHEEYRRWLENLVSSGQAFSIPSVVRSGFLRIVTNPRLNPVPSPFDVAEKFLENFMVCPGFREIHPGPRHWPIFVDLCRKTDAKGNLVPDAYLAALAIECGGKWMTADKDYRKFPGLRWRNPLDYGEDEAGPVRIQEKSRVYRVKKASPRKAKK